MVKWKSLYIYYISGTGNARASSEWIADEADQKGLKTVVQQIDRLENIVIPSMDERPLIGLHHLLHFSFGQDTDFLKTLKTRRIL
jgi:hypothetical protein